MSTRLLIQITWELSHFETTNNFTAIKTQEDVLELLGEKRTLLNNILRRNVNWIGHILRINCILHDTIERITEMKESREKKNKLIDDLRKQDDIEN